MGHGIEGGIAGVVDKGLLASVASSPSGAAAKQTLQLISYREGGRRK